MERDRKIFCQSFVKITTGHVKYRVNFIEKIQRYDQSDNSKKRFST